MTSEALLASEPSTSEESEVGTTSKLLESEEAYKEWLESEPASEEWLESEAASAEWLESEDAESEVIASDVYHLVKVWIKGAWCVLIQA